MSRRGPEHLSSGPIRLALIASVILLASAAITAAGLFDGDGADQSRRQPEETPGGPPASNGAGKPTVLLSGQLLEIEPGLLSVAGDDGAHTVVVGPATQVVRVVGRTVVSDNDLSRLRPGDSLLIRAEPLEDESFQADSITANACVNRAAIVAGRGDDYLDLRLKLAQTSGDFEPAPTRVWMAPDVSAEWLHPDPSPVFPYQVRLRAGYRDYPLGSVVFIYGFFGDDGSHVVTFLWGHLPPP